jgi:hypothetical protein
LGFADLCLFKNLPVAAVRLYTAAFDAEPESALNAATPHVYNAACAAALAGCGQGGGADTIDDAGRALLRRHALDWMTARFAGETAASAAPAGRSPVRLAMRRWQTDSYLTGVRNAAELAKLPKTERVAWQKLWADVEALKKRCEEPPAEAKPPPKP